VTGKNQNFLGAIGIAFKDTESAINAKKALEGVSLGGVDLLEHNVAFGRPLWDHGEPTTTLMLIGTPKDPEGVNDLSQMLDTLSDIERYKVCESMINLDVSDQYAE
jgi:hypothetical protein